MFVHILSFQCVENPRKIVENRGIFLEFLQNIAHWNPHTVKMDLGIWCLNGELLAIIMTSTSDVLVHSREGVSVIFGGVLDLVHLRFLTKTWLPRFQFFRVCSLFLSILCLLYMQILEICSNRLYTNSSLVLY